jgi:dCTP deaminase
MSFWSGETLAIRLPSLIAPYNPTRIDCASYQLGVGEQAFVTSDELHGTSPNPALITVLGQMPKDLLRIPPGQFAFVLTDEYVTVPDDATALISMRATYKFKGLINVSGFTVDPGWEGKLVFSLYNAGPAPVYLRKGDPVFVIVYASLDRHTTKLYNGQSKYQKNLKHSLLTDLNSQVFSPQVLKSQLDDVHSRLGKILLATGITSGVAAGLAVLTGIVVATVALLPSWVGVVVARTLDAANYEIKQKSDAKVQYTAPLTPGVSSAASGTRAATSAASPAKKGP